jgi:RNA polymerase sigma factor (sigma-70 family)
MAIATDDKDILAMLRSPSQRDLGFSVLLKKYGEQLYWHIRRIVVSHDDAEDAMQEMSINIFNGIGGFKEKCALSTWLYRIATNEALHVLRQRCNFLQSIDSLGESLTEKLEAESPLDAKSAEVLFQKALLQLPAQQRIAFNLRYYNEMPYEQIAQITGKNVGTLKTNYHFAVERIKKYLNEFAL